MSHSLLPVDIAELAARVVAENAALGRRVTTAESCTGGLVAGAITEIEGSSAVFGRGYVTYSNEAKMEALGVSQDIIETFGAVSIACVWAMAQGALERSKRRCRSRDQRRCGTRRWDPIKASRHSRVRPRNA